jgi:hypothetical protein
MSISNFSAAEKKKVSEFIDEGITLLQQVDDLKGSLKDAAAAIAEELDTKPAVLMKALRVAYKANLAEQREGFEQIEAILEATGRAA